MKKTVILLSGGLDSTVAAFCAAKDVGVRGELYALTFDYNQRHRKELESAAKVAAVLKVREHRVFQIDLGQIVNCALVGRDSTPVPSSGVVEGIPSTWVPQRNSVFLSLAFAYAETVEAEAVYIGVTSVDYSGYPDCRYAFVESMTKSLNLASKKFVETGRGIGIVAPLQYLSKSKIVELGIKLEAPFGLTWSCYQGEDKACGVCDSCRIRLAAFEEVSWRDPVEYDSPEEV